MTVFHKWVIWTELLQKEKPFSRWSDQVQGKTILTASQFAWCLALQEDFQSVLCSPSTPMFINISSLSMECKLILFITNDIPYLWGLSSSFFNGFIDFYSCEVVSSSDMRKNKGLIKLSPLHKLLGVHSTDWKSSSNETLCALLNDVIVLIKLLQIPELCRPISSPTLY